IPQLVKYSKENAGDLPKDNKQLAESGVKAHIHERNAILTLDVDVLFLAALGNQVHEDNMKDIKASIIVEGANNPVTEEADKYLSDEGIMIISFFCYRIISAFNNDTCLNILSLLKALIIL